MTETKSEYATAQPPLDAHEASLLRSHRISAQMRELYANDPITHVSITLFLHGQTDYAEALEQIILAQNEVITRQNQMLVDEHNSKAHSYERRLWTQEHA